MFTGEIQRSRSKRPLVIGAVFVVIVVAIVLLLPMPRTLKSTFVLVPFASVEVTAPRDGTIAEVVSPTGTTVARGAVIAKLDTSELDQQVAALEKQAATLEQQKAAKPNPKAKAAVTKAEGALKAATAALEKATKAAKGKKTPALAAAEKKKAAAEAALEKARAAAGPAGDEAGKLLTGVQEQLAALKKQLAEAVVLAPGSGLLSVSGLDKGASVKAGAKLGTVDDVSKLKARVKEPAGEPLKKGQAVELVLSSGKRRVLFDADGKDGVADAEFDNTKAPLAVGLTGEAEIEGEQRSLVSR